jgi:stearoyl-CoA desaturase (delta-9 desaturase)
VAALTFGEGWHNNHHAFPHSACHGLQKGQIDLTWEHIRLMRALGLAKNIRLPIKPA